MVRRSARALCGPRERDVGARANQARRADRHGPGQDLRRLYGEGETLRRYAAIATDAPRRETYFRRDAGMERESRECAHAGRAALERAALCRSNRRTDWRTDRDDR